MKTKVLIVTIIVSLLLIGVIFYLSYLGLKGDPEVENQIKADAQEYLDNNYDEKITVVDTLYDNANIYQEFTYAAIAKIENNDDFRILVFEYKQTGEMIDSLVAETWEHELEQFLNPLLNDAFGKDKIKELWMTYPKDIGKRLNIDSDNIPSLKGQNAHPVIRVTLDRKKEDDDEELLDEIIKKLKNDLNIQSGNISLNYNDNSLFFKSKSIRKDIK
ncbi:hypothetical protein ACLIA0_01790 [Bacillaceae bacterium W0354]